MSRCRKESKEGVNKTNSAPDANSANSANSCACGLSQSAGGRGSHATTAAVSGLALFTLPAELLLPSRLLPA